MMDALFVINSVAWVLGNVLVAYIAAALLAFVTLYYIWFDPRATTAGKFIFRFMLSLVGVVGLVYVGLFIDPSAGREWYMYPGDVAVWRPIARFVIWAYVAFTITSLGALLWYRKFRPDRLLSAPADANLVKVRDTRENPIIRPNHKK